jgi:hypothetical protein
VKPSFGHLLCAGIEKAHPVQDRHQILIIFFCFTLKFRSISLAFLFGFDYNIEKKGVDPMQVTATEFKLNLGKYLELVLTEDIWVTKNGKTVAKLINPNVSAVDSISGVLAGKVPANLDRHCLREERLSKYEIDD